MIRNLITAAIAQTYYNNTTCTVNSSTWFAGMENMALPTLGQMTTRTVSFVIGTGSTIPGGGGFSGTIITGSRSVKSSMMRKLELPEPMMMAARSTVKS